MTPQENPVNWFEIPVHDLDRAKAFYEKVFGTNLDDGGKIVMPKALGGEHGAIARFEDCEGNLVALFSNT